jgi:hypothetical protein
VFTAYDVFLSHADGDGRQQFAEASNAGGWRVVRRGRSDECWRRRKLTSRKAGIRASPCCGYHLGVFDHTVYCSIKFL